MKKKALILILSALLILTMIPFAIISISAASDSIKNLTTGSTYTSLSDAVSAAKAGDTLQLIGNVSVQNPVAVSKNLTIDGNGKTITNTGTGAIFTVSSDVTVEGLKIKSTTGGAFKVVTGGYLVLKDSDVSIKGEGYGNNAVYVNGTAPSVDIYNSSLTGSLQVVGGDAANAVVNVYSGTFTATANDTGVRLFQMYSVGGTWNFYGGSFHAQRGWVFNCPVNGGKVNVYGGSFYDEGSTESLWISKDNAQANFYGGYFYTPNLSHPVSMTANSALTVYGGTFICKNGNPFSVASTATQSILGGVAYSSYYNIQADTLANTPVRLDGASVRLAASSSGIRFTSYVPARIVESIKALADAGTEIEYGTIIAPTDKLEMNLMTLDILGSYLTEGKDYLVIPAKDGLSTDSEGNVTFNAAMINIKAKNYDREFSATAYIKYTMNGVTCYSYSIYDDGDSRSIREVAHRALATNDVTEKYDERQILVLEHYANEKDTDTDYTTVNVLTLNILTHETSFGSFNGKYKFFGTNQSNADYDFESRLEYVKAMVEYSDPDVILFQEFSGPKWWGTVMDLVPVAGKTGIYTSEHFPGYIWVNYQNRRGVLYQNNTDGNPFGSHNFVLYKETKFNLIDSGTRFVSESGERTKEGSWPDNGGGVGGLYDDLGDYTWVVLEDKATGLRSIYASIHTYNGSIQRHAYMLDNLQCVTEFLQKKSTEYGGIPATIGGDFNMNYRDAVQYFSYDHMTDVAHYTDSKYVGSNSGTARVFGNNIAGTNGGSAHGSRIDYIFTNGGEPYAYEVLNGQVVKKNGAYVYDPYCPLDGTGYDISDHLPVMTKLIIGSGDAYKYKTCEKSEFFKNDGPASDEKVSDSSVPSYSIDKMTFTTTDVLKYVELGDKLSADIVKDSEKGNVLRIMATDESNRVSAEIDYFKLFGMTNVKNYTTLTLTYRTDYTISGCTMKFGYMSSHMTEFASSDGWTTVTVNISSLNLLTDGFTIYGALTTTGIVNGDAIYIASIELK